MKRWILLPVVHWAGLEELHHIARSTDVLRQRDQLPEKRDPMKYPLPHCKSAKEREGGRGGGGGGGGGGERDLHYCSLLQGQKYGFS